MKSSEPVFSRQNPFPPASTVKRAHYHPSRKQTLSKKEKKITLSPVRLHQRSNHPPRSLNGESHQLYENLDFPASDGQHLFTEIWPSTESESSPDRNVHFPATLPDKLSAKLETSIVSSGAKEDSVLAKYVERFRHGQPQSREERQQMTWTDDEEHIPFWWMPRSSVPSSTPTKSVDMDGHDSTAYSPAEPPQHDRPFNVASDCSQGEFDDTEILNLQERASRLLLRGEWSSSNGSIPVSSDGVGCSDFSSPVSVDEPLRQPLKPGFMKPTAAKVSPDWAPGASSQKSVIPTVTPPTRPEEDILFQWRLRRKMEEARGSSQSVKQLGLHDSAFSWQAPSLVNASASELPHKQQQSSQPPQFSERDAHPHMPAPAPSPPHFLTAVFPSPSLASQTQVLSHVPAHMHLLCDVLPCPNRSSLANQEQNVSQTFSEPQTKAAHNKTQASESLLSTDDRLIKDSLESSLHASRGNEKEKVPSRQKVLNKKKKTLVAKEPDQKMALPSRQQRKPASLSLPTKIMSLEEQHQHDESEEVHKECCSRSNVPPSSPIHAALGQVVSEVLFPPVAQKTPHPSVSTPKNISSPSQPTLPPYVTQNSLEVISQLLQEAEDSDGKEFEDDPLLQVLRHQRKWVKDQIREVDMMLNEFLEEQPVA